MDNAIQFKESLISALLYVLCLVIAGYSIYVADISLVLRLSAAIGLVFCAWVLIRRGRRIKGLRGFFKLTTEGLISIEDHLDTTTTIYQARVLQRLPWCLNIELSHSAGKFRQLVWKDSLAADDWRRFRAYLTELPSSSLAN